MINIKTKKLKLNTKPKVDIEEGIDAQVSIDTMNLKAKLSHQEIDWIFNYLYYGYYSDDEYEYNLHIKELGFSLSINPKNPFLHTYFNARIILQAKFFKAEYMPYSILEIINTLNWRIRRLDIAFDFKGDKSNTLLYKWHGNQTETHYSTTDYIGNPKNPKKKLSLASYDRNEKEKARGNNITHDYPIRLETRFYFPLKDNQTIHKLDHTYILQRLQQRVLFIRDLSALDINKWTFNRLKELQEENKTIKKYKKNVQKQLKKLIKDNRTEIEMIYLYEKDRLFEAFTYREPQDQHIHKKIS